MAQQVTVASSEPRGRDLHLAEGDKNWKSRERTGLRGMCSLGGARCGPPEALCPRNLEDGLGAGGGRERGVSLPATWGERIRKCLELPTLVETHPASFILSRRLTGKGHGGGWSRTFRGPSLPRSGPASGMGRDRENEST